MQLNVTPNTSHARELACNQSRHFLHYFHAVGCRGLWSWAHTAHCIHANCSLKVKAWGHLHLWSRVTSAVCYRSNVPWHSNGSVPVRIKELFVAHAEDYTTWLLCHHSLIAEAFRTKMCISLVPKQTRHASTQPWNANLCICLGYEVEIVTDIMKEKEKDRGLAVVYFGPESKKSSATPHGNL